MYNYMRTTLNIPTDSIILWGFSIGTAATVHLASTLNDDLAGVILFAPPTSIVRALCWKRCCFCCSKEQPCNNSRKACGVDKFNSIGKVIIFSFILSLKNCLFRLAKLMLPYLSFMESKTKWFQLNMDKHCISIAKQKFHQYVST